MFRVAHVTQEGDLKSRFVTIHKKEGLYAIASVHVKEVMDIKC